MDDRYENGLYMTDVELEREFRNAKSRRNEIKVLAELNDVSEKIIRRVIYKLIYGESDVNAVIDLLRQQGKTDKEIMAELGLAKIRTEPAAVKQRAAKFDLADKQLAELFSDENNLRISNKIIAESLGVSEAYIQRYRRRNGLKAPQEYLHEWKEREFRRLHEAGMNDCEIAQELGITYYVVNEWRNNAGLESNWDIKKREYRSKVQKMEPKIQELYNQGKYDYEIAQIIGCSNRTVMSWRRKKGLPSNWEREKERKQERDEWD